MTNWQRRKFTSAGLTQVPAGPHLALRARRLNSIPRLKRSTSGAVYSQWAGMNALRDAGADQYGNAAGTQYDLIEDGAVTNALVVVLKLCYEVNLAKPRAALERKGFTLVEMSSNDARDIALLEDRLIDAAELWVISDSTQHLEPAAIDLIESFYRQGRGLYIWGDNSPYYVDANRILRRLFNTEMFGNHPGNQVVSLCDDSRKVGLVPGHLVTTGLVNVYEGVTIAEVPTTSSLEPLIYGSNGRVVAAFHDEDGCRAIVDGGFTRLYYEWESAGTDRYIVNAAAWLLNVERFDQGLDVRQ
jgi:hypothetical protein